MMRNRSMPMPSARAWLFGLSLILAACSPGSSELGQASAEADEAAIRILVNDYYSALREKRYKKAATYYQPGILEAAGIDAEKALEAAVSLTGGIPDQYSIEGVVIEGDEARCEIVIPRDPILAGAELMETTESEYGSETRNLGTWARTINFIRVGRSWKISDRSDNTANIDLQSILDDLTKSQQQN